MPAEERGRFDAHLAICDGCVTYVEQMRQAIATVRALRVEDVEATAAGRPARGLPRLEARRADPRHPERAASSPSAPRRCNEPARHRTKRAMNLDHAPRLGTLPVAFPATVAALHRVAEQIVAPARKPDNEIALQATPGGFGTPVFEYDGSSHQVRVDGAELVHRAGDERAARAADVARGRARRSSPTSCPRPARRRRRSASTPPRPRARRLVRVRRRASCATARPRRADPVARALRHRHRARPRSTTASRPATSSTPSPTSTSVRGPRRSRASCGTRAASPAPS